MEKKEYVSPKMETIEITEKYGVMQMTTGSNVGGKYDGGSDDEDF